MSKSNYKDMPELVKRYLYHLLTIKGRSQRTVDAYAIDLRGFFRFYKHFKNLVPKDTLINKIKIDDISLDLIEKVSLLDVYEYLNFVMQENHNSANARARKVSSLRGFFRYLTNNLRLLKENPIDNLELPSIPKTMPKYLTVDQSKNLLESVGSEEESSTKLRDYCILTLFLNCGMRLSELVGINLQSFNLDTGTLKLLGKGNKERIVYLNTACHNSIDDYVKNERNDLSKIVDHQALFLSCRTGKRLGARQVQNIVQKSLKAAGLYGMGFSTHKLRHTAATLMYQHGHVDILVLKEILGHANVGTTEIYTHVANETLKKAIDKNPLSDEKFKENKK